MCKSKMCKVSLFVDMEFPKGRGDQMEKSWKGKSWGVGGVKLGKTLRGGGGGGGMDIFWNHTILKQLARVHTVTLTAIHEMELYILVKSITKDNQV